MLNPHRLFAFATARPALEVHVLDSVICLKVFVAIEDVISLFFWGLFSMETFFVTTVCADLVSTAVNLRAICRMCFSSGIKSSMTLPSMVLMFVESDMNENLVKEANV